MLSDLAAIESKQPKSLWLHNMLNRRDVDKFRHDMDVKGTMKYRLSIFCKSETIYRGVQFNSAGNNPDFMAI